MSIKSTIFAVAVSVSMLVAAQSAHAATGRTNGTGATNGVVSSKTTVSKETKIKNMNDYSPAAGAETPSSETSVQAIEPKKTIEKKAFRSTTGRTVGAGVAQ